LESKDNTKVTSVNIESIERNKICEIIQHYKQKQYILKRGKLIKTYISNLLKEENKVKIRHNFYKQKQRGTVQSKNLTLKSDQESKIISIDITHWGEEKMKQTEA